MHDTSFVQYSESNLNLLLTTDFTGFVKIQRIAFNKFVENGFDLEVFEAKNDLKVVIFDLKVVIFD